MRFIQIPKGALLYLPSGSIKHPELMVETALSAASLDLKIAYACPKMQVKHKMMQQDTKTKYLVIKQLEKQCKLKRRKQM